MLRRQVLFDMSSRVQNVPKMMASKIIGLHLFVCSFAFHFALKTVAAVKVWTHEGFASICWLVATCACEMGT